MSLQLPFSLDLSTKRGKKKKKTIVFYIKTIINYMYSCKEKNKIENNGNLHNESPFSREKIFPLLYSNVSYDNLSTILQPM